MTEKSPLQASERFYEALTRLVNGESAPMASIWSQDEDVTTMHPIGGRQIGWTEVEAAWNEVATLASEGHVELRNQRIQVFGDVACETGVEVGMSRLSGREVTFENRVTNLYRREGGGWKMVHHHADVSPAMLDIVKDASSK